MMISKNLFYALLLSILTFSCADIATSKGSCVTNENAQSLMHDNETREYILYVPASYDGTSAVPLMFNFHGFGGQAREYMNDADMRSLAESENFILVYPQGTCLDGFPHWNAALDTPTNKSDADDFGFIEVLINELSSNYMIDSERIYSCGYSNGAFFSYALACYHSDKIAAIGSVSGTMLDISTSCVPSHPLAIIDIHGTSDSVIPYEGSSDYTSIDATLNYWVNFNNCNSTPIINSVNDNGTTIDYYQYTGGDSGVSIEHYKINGGEHVWFNMDYQGSNTSQLIWNHLSKYDINGLR